MYIVPVLCMYLLNLFSFICEPRKLCAGINSHMLSIFLKKLSLSLILINLFVNVFTVWVFFYFHMNSSKCSKICFFFYLPKNDLISLHIRAFFVIFFPFIFNSKCTIKSSFSPGCCTHYEC